MYIMKMNYLLILINLLSCANYRTTSDDIKILKKKIQNLEGIQSNLTNLVNSEFNTCDPLIGATVDSLIKKICNVAKASTEEAKLELKSQISQYAILLKSQITSLNIDIASNISNIDTINTTILTIQSTITSIQTDVSNLQSAITNLQTLTNSINGILNSNLVSISIGEENVSAGPIYETLLKRVDNTRFNGYIEIYEGSIAINNNGISVVNSSNVVVVNTSLAHNMVVGNYVRIYGISPGRGLTSLDLNGDFVVTSIPTTSQFTFLASRNASSTGTLGGANGSIREFIGKGLGTLWKSLDVSDSQVRTTTIGSKVYNFIIRRKASDISNTTAEMCYDCTNNNATYSSINSASEGGSGGIICK